MENPLKHFAELRDPRVERNRGRRFHSLRLGRGGRLIGSSLGRRSNIWLLEMDEEHRNQHNECHES
jgi:hypothetical protein